MILRSKPSLSLHPLPSSDAAAAPAATVPDWLRRAVPDAQTVAAQGFGPLTLEDIALAAGAAIGALDQIVRRQEKLAGAWRQRLALGAAAVTTKQAGRVEDESALRDAVLLTHPSDEVGPAGRMFLAWRRLASRPAEELLKEKSLVAVLEEFGYAGDDAAVSNLGDDLRHLAASDGTMGMMSGALAIAERHGFGRVLGAWFADVVLAQRLGWTYALPLLGTETSLAKNAARPRRSTLGERAPHLETGPDRTKKLLAAQARAALRAIDLFVDLERRAQKLLAVAPKLRAKGANLVVENLLADDALMASRGDRIKKAGMSDRALRRLFDRLVELGAVRELSGRATFRIYGL